MHRFGTLVVVMALVGAACSGAGAGSTTTSVATSAGGESLQDFIPGMPSFDPSDQAAAAAQARQMEQRVQELVAECMAEQGFEYVPYVPNMDGMGFNEADYVDEFGFGMATQVLVDDAEMQRRMEEEMGADPNQAIVEAMTEQERQAYNDALWGPQPEIDPETMSEEEIQAAFENFQPTGCMAEAQDAVYNQQAAMEFFNRFGPDLEEQFSRIESDPRIQGLNDQWAACMKDKGYDDFTQPSDAELYIARQLEAIGVITDLEIGPNGEMMGFGMEGIQPDDPRRSQIEAIADEEVALAKASLECSKLFAEVYEEVQREYEQRFIEEHRAELEAFREEHAGG